MGGPGKTIEVQEILEAIVAIGEKVERIEDALGKATCSQRLLDVPSFVEYTGQGSEGNIRKRIAPGAKDPFPIQPIRIGARVYFDRLEVDRWIDKMNSEAQK